MRIMHIINSRTAPFQGWKVFSRNIEDREWTRFYPPMKRTKEEVVFMTLIHFSNRAYRRYKKTYRMKNDIVYVTFEEENNFTEYQYKLQKIEIPCT